MLIKLLPDFDLIGEASTPTEMVEAIKPIASIDHGIESYTSVHACAYDPLTKAWYVAAVKETQHELTHTNGDHLLP